MSSDMPSSAFPQGVAEERSDMVIRNEWTIYDMHIGNSKINWDPAPIQGELVKLENERYYRISNYDRMRPFFMSIVSDSNQWMFISSTGGLTAGRKDSQSALFPYYTDDKIMESSEITGSKTLFQVHLNDRKFLWEPFSDNYSGVYAIQRNLYKNEHGNKIVFEEINNDLGLTFRYHWNSSRQYGFVKRGSLVSNTEDTIKITVLDGIQNIMPYGVDPALQNVSSNLVDAYKKNELDVTMGLGIYSLSAKIVDRAEPSEALKATTVWSTGFEDAIFLLSSLQLNAFRKGRKMVQEREIKAEKGAFFLFANTVLIPGVEKQWLMVAEVNQSAVDVVDVGLKLKNKADLAEKVLKDINRGTTELVALNAASDALQLTADDLRNTRHFSNTLFNIMRGGIFDANYNIGKDDFVAYIKKANKEVYQQKTPQLAKLGDVITLGDLRQLVKNDANPNFKRLAYEYLPLRFSRRHGDPSRPWNRFAINTETEDGKKVLDYEGNWRDIFQNWEALVHSYPAFVESIIFKFLNATTFDGYNPYRITKDGFDWETIEPDDPWSYIGYWGDHQIIYLLKLLEFMERHYPHKLVSYFQQDIFVYANVPYKIKDYSDILKNPKDTIIFDEELDASIKAEKEHQGADAALLKDINKAIYQVNLLEKLLATLLAKISNFVPEGGIWMNTQRPEWNDANNALVGNGVSMVTLYYLRRFLKFFEGILENEDSNAYTISSELLVFFNAVNESLLKYLPVLAGKISDRDRKAVMDKLGNAGAQYRTTVYKHCFAAKKGAIDSKELLQFTQVVLEYLEHSIKANKREDNLYHAYNLLTIENKDEVSISHLAEMLEGQVSVLSSGSLSAEASLEVLDALKKSALFRKDQYSYMLYPNRQLPNFTEKNNIPGKKIEKSVLVRRLLEAGDGRIVQKDAQGNYHFNGTFNNAESLKDALSQLPEVYDELIRKDRTLLLDLFEEVFDHKAFTGRSGTFFAYEGLGSIYWHMVSKLLLAVQETCLRAIKDNESEAIIRKLVAHYYEINEGIGVHKSPELYGAFPTDPYSHTPEGRGAQQPGMTGQVKEDILCRFGELGIFVKNGRLTFEPWLLQKEEFLKRPTTFTYISVPGDTKHVALKKDTLCFTYCQIPIVYSKSKEKKVRVLQTNGKTLEFVGSELDLRTSTKIFERTGEIEHITVAIGN